MHAFTPTQVEQQDDDVDIFNLLMMMWRRRILILSILMIGLSLAVMALQVITPLYKSRGVVLVEGPASLSGAGAFKSQLGNALLGSINGGDVITSDIEIIRSRSFVARVLKQLGSIESEEDDVVAGRSDFKSLVIDSNQFKSLPAQAINPAMIEAISGFKERLVVRAVPGSNAFQVEFTAESPERAAYTVNTILQMYMNERALKMSQESQRLRSWLDERVDQMRASLREKEAAIKAVQEESGITLTPGSIIGGEQVNALYNQLSQAKAKKSTIQARLSYLENVRRGYSSLDTAPEVLRSEIIGKLKLEAVRLEGLTSELSERYGERHPRMIKARAELTELNRSIQVEMQKAAQTAKTELSLINAQIASIEQGVDELKTEVFESSDTSLDLIELEREAQVIKTSMEGLVKAYAIADQQALLSESKARIISNPAIPTRAFFPNKKLIVGLTMIVCLFTALILVLLIEKLDKTFRSPAGLDGLMGVPCIALLPYLKVKNKADMAAYPLRNPGAHITDALQTLRMEIKLKKIDALHAPKVVALTSSYPSEGKTTLSVWLARLAAKAGERVIVIDADLRRPNVHKILARNNDLSLVDYLTDKASRVDVIMNDPDSGADFIFARTATHAALDLINSDKMRDLISDLRNDYDLILIDTPATLAASDARLLSSFSDMMLYIVGWRKTSKDAVIGGLKPFIRHQSETGKSTPIAFVLSHVDVRRYVRYGYGETLYDRAREKSS